MPFFAKALILVNASATDSGVIFVKVFSTTLLALASVDFLAIALTVVVASIENGAVYSKHVDDVVVVGASPFNV